MMNFIAQSMRRFGLAPDNKVKPSTVAGARAEGGNSPISHMMMGSKWSYSTLEYPSDIQSRSDQGHYMMFYINEAVDGPSITGSRTKGGRRGSADLLSKHQEYQNKFKPVVTGNAAASLKTQQNSISNSSSYSENMATDTASGTYANQGATNKWMPGSANKIIGRQAYQGTAATLLNYKRTKRTTDSIVLYMPPNLTVNYAAAYKEEELGSTFVDLAAKGAEAMNSSLSEVLMAGGGQGIKDVAKNISDMLKDAGGKTMAASGAGNPIAIKNKLENQAMNNYLEVMFTGIAHRKFSYTWKFTPKNPRESIEVDKIIRQFKFHMLPEKPSDTSFGRYWITPSEFDIFYMFRGDENTWLNKVSTCVLMNMDVNWTPNQYQTFRPIANRNGAPPVEVDLKLDFMETKLITKAEATDGY